MFGVILFWLHYIIAGVLLYHLLRCIYVKGEVVKGYRRNTYNKTDHDKKLKYPLWIILLFLVVFCIPILNIITYIGFLCYRLIDKNGDEYNRYYCKSTFTKKY